MKTLHKTIILIALSLFFAQCQQEVKQNIIKCEIEGLQKGDKIILSLGTVTETPEKVDSIIYNGQKTFELKTTATDVMARITVISKNKDDEKAPQSAPKEAHIFLEGYANLILKENVKNLYYAQCSGGLYDLPEMQKIEKIAFQINEISKETFRLYNEYKNNKSLKKENIDSLPLKKAICKK